MIPDKKPAALQGSLGQTFVLPIENGRGRQSSVRETTFFVKITGLATITEPAEGTWHLVVNDTVAHKTILDQKNVTAGVAIPFAYRTGMHAQIQVDATWDRKEDTTLKVKIDAKY